MDIGKQLEIIKRGAVDIFSEEELIKKLQASAKDKKPLKIKAGFDPTAPDLHLGHSVLLRKLRQFQDLGHEVYFLIGDFTARIGDPSGRSQIRKQLAKQEAEKNAATYKKQVSKILDTGRLKIVFNSSWFDKLSVLEMLRLTAHATVSQMLVRADFKKRLAQNQNISLLEFMYPILQGYDSVKLQADVELGGTDQIFNLLIGRDIQRDFGQPEQVVLTMPLLEGTDGAQKMSKSFDNYIGIDEPAGGIFGKIMSISDELMWKYYELLTDEDMDEVKKLHPKEAKARLAEDIVSQYHSKEKARGAKDEFEKVFSQKELPADIPTYKMPASGANIIDILISAKAVSSKNDARRLLAQGGVYLNGARLENEDSIINSEGVLKAGKRRFLKLVK